MRSIELIHTVKKAAVGGWPNLLPLCGVTVPERGKHGACPTCGGTDRFHFIDDHHGGEWHCRQCDAPNHGDGLDLVARANGITVTAAAEQVAQALGMEPRSTSGGQKTAERTPGVQAQSTPADGQPETAKPIAERVAALLVKARPGVSAYLTGKGLHCPHLPILPDGSLVLPLCQMDSVITGAQLIRQDGGKKLLAGTQKKGAFIALADLPEQAGSVVIAEGYATAQSVALLVPDAVHLAALDAGNLLRVAEAARARWPNARITVAADNDWHAPGELDEQGKPKRNTGKLSAEKAAAAVSGWVTLPPTDHPADWDDYRQQNGIEAAANDFASVMYQPQGAVVTSTTATSDSTRRPELHQMAASQRGALLAARYGQVVVNPESEAVYHYNGATWDKVPDSELRREMVAIFNENETPYSPTGINNAIEALKLQIPVIGEQPRHLIGFSNGVYDLSGKVFRAHRAGDWLLNHNGIAFTPPAPGENLPTHATSFYKWLNHAAGGEQDKMDRIKAALFMVLANRYDWQMFIEVTGEGGSGKSVFTHIATLLAGEHNTASGNMRSLDEARGRAQFVGKSLITLPDQVKYVGEGAGIKAITGGDMVEIDGKYEKQFSIVLHAVVLATNNEPMAFTERQGGIARRRVIFAFNHPVSEADKDRDLSAKISAELPVIIRHLLDVFADQDKAKALLLQQRDSDEAMGVKRNTDPMYGFCAHIVALGEAVGMYMGNRNITPRAPRIYLYHAYLAYMDAHGYDRPLTLTKFGADFPKVMKEYGAEYKKNKTNGGMRYNMALSGSADEWLPAVPMQSPG